MEHDVLGPACALMSLRQPCRSACCPKACRHCDWPLTCVHTAHADSQASYELEYITELSAVCEVCSSALAHVRPCVQASATSQSSTHCTA